MQCLLEGASSGACAPFCVGLFFAEDTFSKSRCLFFHLFFPVARTQQEAFWGWSSKGSPSLQPPWEQSWGPGWLSSRRGLEWSDWGTGLGDFNPQLRCGGGWGGGWLAVGMGSLVSSETQLSLLPRLPAHALGRTMPGPFQTQGFFYIISPAFPGNRPLSIPKLF